MKHICRRTKQGSQQEARGGKPLPRQVLTTKANCTASIAQQTWHYRLWKGLHRQVKHGARMQSSPFLGTYKQTLRKHPNQQQG
eukprot:1161514-Pelagomonas_calceolata.AAC.4